MTKWERIYNRIELMPDAISAPIFALAQHAREVGGVLEFRLHGDPAAADDSANGWYSRFLRKERLGAAAAAADMRAKRKVATQRAAAMIAALNASGIAAHRGRTDTIAVLSARR